MTMRGQKDGAVADVGGKRGDASQDSSIRKAVTERFEFGVWVLYMMEAMTQEGECLFGISQTEGLGHNRAIFHCLMCGPPATSCTEGPNE
jgi:hypothetical protein